MPPESPDTYLSLGIKILMGLATFAGSIFGLWRLVFGGVYKRLDEIADRNDISNAATLAEVQKISGTMAGQAMTIALIQKDVGILDGGLKSLDNRIEKQAEFYRGLHEQTRRDFDAFRGEVTKDLSRNQRRRGSDDE